MRLPAVIVYRSRPKLVATMVLTLGFLTAACGVPIDSGPRTLPHSELPGVLSQATVPLGPSTTLKNSRVIPIYFVDNGFLQPRVRYEKSAPTAGEVLALLNGGVEPGEVADGFRTDVFGQLSLESPAIQKHTINVNLSQDFFDVSGTPFYLALGQVVFSLVENLPGVTSVQFWWNGQKYAVPDATGSIVSRPVNECDYNIQLQRPKSACYITSKPGTRSNPPG